jgi:type I restriction enzyme, S subunit
MSFPRYERYKDSGTKWLGEVPENWEVSTIRRVAASVQTGGTPSTESPNSELVDGVPWYTPGDFGNSIELSGSSKKICQSVIDSGEARIFPPESVLIVSIGATLGKTGYLQEFASANQQINAVIPGSKVYGNYLAYSLSIMSEAMRFFSNASTIGIMNQEKTKEIHLTFPALDIQYLIVAFLDNENAKIDRLIGEQECLITLLREKRQAVISRAVTKGLDPDTPMKDSGIHWLGKVPKAWKVTRLKFVATVQTGIAKGKDNTGKSTVEVPYLRVANVQDGYLSLEEIATIHIPSDELQRYSLKIGDVLMNEGGDFDKLGRGHIWQGEIAPCIHQNHVFAVRPATISPAWLNTVTGSNYAQFYFMTRSKQSTNLASISSTNVMELPLVLPPEEEQSSILDFLAAETARLDVLETEAQKSVALLKERRTALISAAVTGKIDVRKLSVL